MSGGAYEYVAAYYNRGDTLVNGSSFASIGKDNTKWSMAYKGQNIEINALIGDATKEVKNWNNDSSYFVAKTVPFLDRGGGYKNSSNAGIFFSGREDGSSKDSAGFRMCIITK